MRPRTRVRFPPPPLQGNRLIAALAEGAGGTLVLWFGLSHDARLENEHRGPEHELRGGAYAREVAAAVVLRLESERIALLYWRSSSTRTG